MPTMKNLHCSCAIALLLACVTASAASPLKLHADGTVRLGKQKKMLQIYAYQPTFEVPDGMYFYGYKRLLDKTEVPMVAYLSNDLKQEVYWQFTDTINEFFMYKNQVHLLDYEGQIFVKTTDNWKKIPLKVSPRSSIFFKDSFLIACHSRSPFKEGKETGGCEAPEKNWSFTLNWLDVPPKICNQRLTLRVFNIRPPYHVVQFDMETGKELATKIVHKPVTDVCSVKFD
jgi:hypothetical protein